ncbi:MAG: PBP1 and LysM peptidoglycan-binding domain-containing protein [Bacteroidota bacterium]
MRIITACILIFTAMVAYGQEVGEEVRGDQVFKVHVVEEGNTLYGLHRKYNTPIEAIIQENPEAAEGLQIGQRLYIPVAVPEPEGVIHEVGPKETLFGISRAYDCSVDDLIEANPGAEKGLQIGQKLVIPISENESETAEDSVPPDSIQQDTNKVRYEVDFTDSIVNYEVQRGETLYSISRRFMVDVDTLKRVNELRRNKIKPNQQLIIPLKKERVERVAVKSVQPADTIVKDTARPTFEQKEQYRIVVFAPLKIEDNQEIVKSKYDEKSRLREVTNIALDFLMGIEMALDSLEQLGLNATVEIIDTRGSEAVVKKALEQEEDVDLIIGPFYPKLVEYTAKWCKENEVRLLAVTKVATTVLKENPYVYAMIPSELTLIAAMAEYMALEHADDNLFLIRGGNEKVKKRNQLFTSVYQQFLPDSSSNMIRSVNVGSESGRELSQLVDEDTANFFIYLSNDVQDVMHFVNTLNAAKNYKRRLSDAKIAMVGTQEWLNFDALNTYYRNRFKFHYAASSFLDYYTEKSKPFIEEFRNEFGADPSKYAFHGFDIMLGQGAQMLLNIDRSKGIMNAFSMATIGRKHGYENTSAFISKQEDYEIHLLRLLSKEKNFGFDPVEHN